MGEKQSTTTTSVSSVQARAESSKSTETAGEQTKTSSAFLTVPGHQSRSARPKSDTDSSGSHNDNTDLKELFAKVPQRKKS